MTKPNDPIEPLSVTRPPQPHAGHCLNCETVLQGSYCHVCGQHAHNPLKSLRHAVEDVFESVWHIDGRIFRTLRELWVPGRVAIHYLAGHRVRYIPPLRLFVILSLLTFFIAHFAIEKSGVRLIELDNDQIAAASTVADTQAAREVALARLQARIEALAPGPGQAGQQAALEARRDVIDSVAKARIEALQRAQAAGLPPPDAQRDIDTFQVGDRPWDARTNPVKVGWLPAFANEWLNAGIGRGLANARHYMRDQDGLKDAWVSAIPTALFFLVPVFALLLRAAYAFTPWTYLEHLVVALYSHAFLLLGALLAMLVLVASRAAGFAGMGEAAAGWIIAAMALYLLWMQKRVYLQGWPLTLLKFGVIGTLYSILLGIGALAALVTVFLK